MPEASAGGGGDEPPQALPAALWSLRRQALAGALPRGRGSSSRTSDLIRTTVLDRPRRPRPRDAKRKRPLQAHEAPGASVDEELSPMADKKAEVLEEGATALQEDNEEDPFRDLRRLRRRLAEEASEGATASEAERWRSKLRDVRAVYLHGLRTVSALQNLRDAPDAILPGNFPPPKPTTLLTPASNSADSRAATGVTK